MPGMGELIIILLIVLVVFGASKLPAIGDALGRSIKNFKRSSKVEGDEEDKELESKDAKQLPTASPKQIMESSSKSDDGEWEEVVVRRRKKSADS
ncbi:MAG: twin-arginine translocase TatA/TatE family subunit [Myxococcota bacterium]|nr:twin-arginine translocase TatA/TatE family subunit [Deltaproteobacteria bacterium]MDQ3340074.1 twin-arginine translocase TatA/TatE family subunit [Myxococcota bacterium]